MTPTTRFRILLAIAILSCSSLFCADDAAWKVIAPYFTPPAEYANQFGSYATQLKFYDGSPVKDAADWPKRRQEILTKWHELMGPWPALIEKPRFEMVSHEKRENFTQHKIRVEVAKDVMSNGVLCVPDGNGPFPAVFVPYYETETSLGLKGEKGAFRDYAYQLAKRGFVTLCIGSPGGDARKPDTGKAPTQPMSFLGYIAANCHTALAQRPEVDPARIGIVGHSYGGKWSMFGSCLHEKYACAVWSDPGIVFDDTRANVNYWDPWYLGLEPNHSRKIGLPTADNPAVGPYKIMRDTGRDLHELHALMAPRPFLVSGGSEDFPARWVALNRTFEVNNFLGVKNRVAMTNRKQHSPDAESNDVVYAFFEWFLNPRK